VTVNSIYNSLPDIISSLSGSNEITKDGFKRIMQYLFQFVTQERHTESLVDKLCLRFRDCQGMYRPSIGQLSRKKCAVLMLPLFFARCQTLRARTTLPIA